MTAEERIEAEREMARRDKATKKVKGRIPEAFLDEGSNMESEIERNLFQERLRMNHIDDNMENID